MLLLSIELQRTIIMAKALKFSAENCSLMAVAFNGMQQQNQPWKSAKM
jgi:hypothetical protein